MSPTMMHLMQPYRDELYTSKREGGKYSSPRDMLNFNTVAKARRVREANQRFEAKRNTMNMKATKIYGEA